MKTRSTFLLIGILTLSLVNTVSAHENGHRNDYGRSAVSGGAGVWFDSYGNVQYAANVAVGSGYGYPAVPAYGPGYGYQCNHRSHRADGRGYNQGYRHGKQRGHKRHHKHGRDNHRHH
jgi:hypothetical protein